MWQSKIALTSHSHACQKKTWAYSSGIGHVVNLYAGLTNPVPTEIQHPYIIIMSLQYNFEINHTRPERCSVFLAHYIIGIGAPFRLLYVA
jgi:hypothetical protein